MIPTQQKISSLLEEKAGLRKEELAAVHRCSMGPGAGRWLFLIICIENRIIKEFKRRNRRKNRKRIREVEEEEKTRRRGGRRRRSLPVEVFARIKHLWSPLHSFLFLHSSEVFPY